MCPSIIVRSRNAHLAAHVDDVALDEAVLHHLVRRAGLIAALAEYIGHAGKVDAVGHAPRARIEQVPRQIAGDHKRLPLAPADRVVAFRTGLERPVDAAPFEKHICRRVVMSSGEKLGGFAPTLAAVNRTRDNDLAAQAPVADAVEFLADGKQRWPDDVERGHLAPSTAAVIADKNLKLVGDLLNQGLRTEPLIAGDQPARRQLRQTRRTGVHVVRVS